MHSGRPPEYRRDTGLLPQSLLSVWGPGRSQPAGVLEIRIVSPALIKRQFVDPEPLGADEIIQISRVFRFKKDSTPLS